MMFIVYIVATADEAKNGMGIDVIVQGQAVSKKDGLKRLDMAPSGFVVEEPGEEDHAAVIVEGSDQIPLFASGGSPEVEGRVMLDEFASIPRNHLAVMGGTLGFGEVETLLLGATDYRG